VSLENNEQVKSDGNQEHSAKVDNSRRSFAKKSAALAPIIMTLSNRTAWAQGDNGHCTSHAAFLSYAANPTISHAHAAQVPGWLSPSGWSSSTNSSNLNATINAIKAGEDQNSTISEVWTDFGNDPTTVIQALQTSSTLKYDIASRLNMQVNPHTILQDLIANDNLNEYSAFYNSICITGIFP
jgi:hypothetical protein